MIPQSLEHRKKLNDLINRGVQLEREIDQLKDDMKQLKEEVKEEVGKEYVKDYPKMVKIRYSTGKVHQDAESKLELIAELEILEKGEQSEVNFDGRG
jgi:hypothetical protein